MKIQKSTILILVLNQSPLVRFFQIVRMPGDQNTALTGESLYYHSYVLWTFILSFWLVEGLGIQRKSNQNTIEKFKPIETDTAKFSLNRVKFWSKNLPNFVYPILILQNRSHTAVHAYFLNHLPLSQQWIEIHFEVFPF